MWPSRWCLLIVSALLASPVCYGVTEADIWVPKRYTIAKHKLLSTAVEAERTDRCVRAVHGQLNVEKTTKEAYYFIITCRDKRSISYNLSYSYPVNGAAPVLLNEQKIIVPELEVIEDIPTITANEAWPLCIADLKTKIRTMLDVTVIEDNPNPSDEGLQQQDLIIPFEAKNPQGSVLRYQADCSVDVDKNVSLKISPRRLSAS